MYVGKDFDDADPGETDVLAFDYVNDMAEAEALASATFSCEAIEGTDASASSRLSGSASIVASDETGRNTVAAQFVTGLVAGVRYRIRCLAVTDNNKTLSLYSRIYCRALGP